MKCSDCGKKPSAVSGQINHKPYCLKHFNKRAKPVKSQQHGVIEGRLV